MDAPEEPYESMIEEQAAALEHVGIAILILFKSFYVCAKDR